MVTVLFIDDDDFMLRALRRLAQRLRPDWNFITVDDGSSWQHEIDATRPPHLVVCDYLMPKMNGDKVLAEVMNAYPTSIRAMLTGDATIEVIKGLGDESHFIVLSYCMVPHEFNTIVVDPTAKHYLLMSFITIHLIQLNYLYISVAVDRVLSFLNFSASHSLKFFHRQLCSQQPQFS